MTTEQITILLIEDNAGDALLIKETLAEESASRFVLLHTTHLETGLDRLAQGGIDLALVDLSLPDSQGIDTFNAVHAHSPEVPIVVLTGLKDDAAEIQVLRAGGQDFLSKGFLNLSVIDRSIRHAVMRKQTTITDEVKLAIAAKNREHDYFLRVLSEEFRAPLAVALGSVRAKTDKPAANGDLLPTLVTLRRYLEQQARLLDDLLTYSRVGTRNPPRQPTTCENALKRALANLKSSIAETGAVVTHDPLPPVWVDEPELEKVFQNLIGTAIKYQGKDQPRVHISAQRLGEEWVFSIQYNGISVDPKNADRLFTIFQRMHDNDEYPGAGISLAICKKIVESHAGRIWAEWEPGQGSRFYFALPAMVRRDQ